MDWFFRSGYTEAHGEAGDAVVGDPFGDSIGNSVGDPVRDDVGGDCRVTPFAGDSVSCSVDGPVCDGAVGGTVDDP